MRVVISSDGDMSANNEKAGSAVMTVVSKRRSVLRSISSAVAPGAKNACRQVKGAGIGVPLPRDGVSKFHDSTRSVFERAPSAPM